MIRDAVGRLHQFPTAPRRVVSLVPSLTETLFDLGAGTSVVGVTDFCIFPPEARDRAAVVGGTKTPDVDRIRALDPDLVHMNLEENLARHAEALQAFVPVFVSEPKSVRDARDLIETLGRIHQRPHEAREYTSAIDREIAQLSSRPFTFACPIWKDPWMWCGGDTYVSDLVSIAGGTNVLSDRDRYPRASFEEVIALRPDIIFLPDEPYEFTTDDAAHFPPIRVVGPFPGHLFTWHGTRTVKGLQFLKRALL